MSSLSLAPQSRRLLHAAGLFVEVGDMLCRLPNKERGDGRKAGSVSGMAHAAQAVLVRARPFCLCHCGDDEVPRVGPDLAYRSCRCFDHGQLHGHAEQKAIEAGEPLRRVKRPCETVFNAASPNIKAYHKEPKLQSSGWRPQHGMPRSSRHEQRCSSD